MAKSAIIVNGFQNLKHDMEPDRLTPKVTELETTTSGVYYFTKYRKKNTIQMVKEKFPGTTLWPASAFQGCLVYG